MTNYYRLDWQEQGVLGGAIAGAQVYVLSQPTTNTTSVPPAPLASLYTDSTGATPLAQPLITNGFGETDAYMLGGIYTVLVVYNGQITAVYPDQTIGAFTLGFVTSNEGSLPVGSILLGNGGDDIIAGPLLNNNPNTYLNGQGVFAAVLGFPTTFTPVTNKFLTGFNAVTGLFSAAQVSYSQISGPPLLPATFSGSPSNFFTSYNSTTGLFNAAQPAFTDISGVASAAQLPTFLGTGFGNVQGAVPVTGGVGSTYFLSAAGTWLVPAGSGVGLTSVGVSMPSVFAVANSPLTSNGTITVTFATGQTANEVLASPNGSSGAVSLRALVAADIPGLPASQITSGFLGLANGGFGLSLSGQGGTVDTTGQFVLKMNASSVISAAALTGPDMPLHTVELVYIIDGGGSVPATGAYQSLNIPIGMTITSWTITGNVSGSCVLGLSYCTNATFPGSLTSIVSSAPPTVTSAQIASSSTLTGWTTALAAASQLEVTLTSVTSMTRIVLSVICSAAYA